MFPVFSVTDVPGCSPSASRLPLQGQLPAARGAVPQIEVDERLVGNLELRGEPLEIRHRRRVESDRHRLLETTGVGVATALRKVVFASHRCHLASYCWRSTLVAFRAEMIRMMSSCARYVWTTTSTRNAALRPSSMNRSSSPEWSGSSRRRAYSSAKTVVASSNPIALVLGVLPTVPLEPGRRHAQMYVRCRYVV